MCLDSNLSADRDKNSLLIEFFEINRDTFLIVDKDMKIIYINPRIERLSNVEKEKVIGKVFWNVFPLSKEPLSFKKYQAALDTKIPQHWERFSKFTNSWAEISAYPLETGGLIIIGRDITEKKQMELELKENSRLELIEREKEYLEILDSSFLGSFIIDFEEKKCHISETWKKRLGLEDLSNEEIFAISPQIFRSGSTNQTEISSMDLIDEKTPKYSAEYKVKTVDSGHIWVLGQAKIIHNEKGKPAKAYGTHIDITHRKLFENALRRSERRSHRLAKSLHKENIYKNNFISTLSHELRNPLAAISMGLSLMEHTSPGSEQDMYAREVIERQTFQLKRLVDDILDVTKSKTNKFKLVKKTVEINKIIKETLDEFKALFDAKEIILKEECCVESIYINGDSARIKQAIGNLLSNSFKFTDKNGIVEFTVSKDDKTNNVVIRIADNGIGIHPALLPDLFKPFVQADTSLARSAGGLGLGLSIVKEIIDLHGGSIKAKSEGPDKGAEFIVKLPLERQGQ
ncbi:MAG: PAS domain S-box protein [Clostridiales bacterium]|nr:PAS domain S-box protein [Clostridiales bacterium]